MTHAIGYRDNVNFLEYLSYSFLRHCVDKKKSFAIDSLKFANCPGASKYRPTSNAYF